MQLYERFVASVFYSCKIYFDVAVVAVVAVVIVVVVVAHFLSLGGEKWLEGLSDDF